MISNPYIIFPLSLKSLACMNNNNAADNERITSVKHTQLITNIVDGHCYTKTKTSYYITLRYFVI